ncbi:MAG: hypothetical protein GY866_04500 [Proteobacteria bacterium]|nr:hypothetical protein [Pseudomonadota bacterium]
MKKRETPGNIFSLTAAQVVNFSTRRFRTASKVLDSLYTKEFPAELGLMKNEGRQNVAKPYLMKFNKIQKNPDQKKVKNYNKRIRANTGYDHK